MKPRVKSVIQGVHMGLGHDGLALLLKKTGKNRRAQAFGR